MPKGDGQGRARRGFWFWFPRLFVLGMVASVWLNLPQYLQGMEERAYVVWLARVLWVVGLPAAFAGILVLIGRKWRK